MHEPQENQELLTAEQEVELARRVHGDDRADAIAARDELVMHNIGLVGKLVGRMVNHWRHLEYDDLFAEALVWLVQVAQRYDPEKHHARFSSYAVPDIRGRLGHYVNSKRKPEQAALDEPIDPAPQPLERIILADEFGAAVAALNQLPPMKAYIIARRFGLGEAKASTLQEIAYDLGCSREYVRQVEARALDQLWFRAR